MVEYPANIMLAPLAGVSETVFRCICRRHGAGMVYSEMVSAEGLLRAGKQTLRLLAFDPSERPIGIQLFGSDPDRMAEAAQRVEELARPDVINLNSGCPVPKVVNRQSGAALLRDPKRFELIVTAMVKAVRTPITVKLRSGYNTHQWVDTEFARIAEASGAQSVILHPRSKAMRYTGHSFWERIALVKQAVGIPVIGNGDIVSGADAKRMIDETGCDGVMIGRGAFGNPWLFREIRQVLAGETVTPVTQKERRATALSHIAAYRETHGERLAGKEMRKHVAWYLKGQLNATLYRDRVFRAKGIEELERVLAEALP